MQRRLRILPLSEFTLYVVIVCLLTACGGRHGGDVAEHVRRVDEAYDYLKVHRELLYDNLDEEAEWLAQHAHYAHAGKTYYILGAYANASGNDSTAMYYLKQAEQCWQQAPDAPAALQGMTYYKQGRVSENEMLNDVALYHYRRALPYLQEAGDSLYLSTIYREIARTTHDTAERNACFAQAMAYAEGLDESLRLDTRYAMLSAQDSGHTSRVAISAQLCEQAGMERYAADVVRDALRQGDMARAERYLRVLAKDTSALRWSNRQYKLLTARYLYLSGQTAEAYSALEALYQERIGQMEQEGSARSYTIAERFDNAAEREKNLRLSMKNQLQLWLLIVGGLVLLLAVLIGAMVYVVDVARRKVEKAQAEVQVAELEATVNEKQEQMRHVLVQQIGKVKKDGNIFGDAKSWVDFRQAMDAAYDGMLTQIETDYPTLTSADMQMIALTALGMASSDICVLLNVNKQSLWNRRQRINEHLQRADETVNLNTLLEKYGVKTQN